MQNSISITLTKIINLFYCIYIALFTQKEKKEQVITKQLIHIACGV